MLGDLLRKGLATGLGIVWLTKERAEEYVSEMVRQGKINLDQSRDTVDHLLQEADEQRSQLQKLINAQTDRALEAAGLARLSDLKSLEERVAALEHRLDGASGQDASH
jgi:polyhydroxyalkanoate synthesis regulator phasin